MATLQPDTYGQYEYAKNPSGTAPGNLYGNSFIPQILSTTLSDSVANSDTEQVGATKSLADLMSVLDAMFTTTELKVLSESLALAQTFSNTPTRVLADSLSVQDNSLPISFIKAITDI